MARALRIERPGGRYHLSARGNERKPIYRDDSDRAHFLELLGEATKRFAIRVHAYVLMDNHFHLLVWPRGHGDLSASLMWLTTAHVRRYHQHYHSSGHVWQGRFRSFPIQDDDHLLTVHRYIERNPVGAGLVERAQQ